MSRTTRRQHNSRTLMEESTWTDREVRQVGREVHQIDNGIKDHGTFGGRNKGLSKEQVIRRSQVKYHTDNGGHNHHRDTYAARERNRVLESIFGREDYRNSRYEDEDDNG